MSSVSRLRKDKPDPVAGGFYTVREAARLLNIAQSARVTAWLTGHKGSASGPVVQRQYEPLGTVQELGFLDLLEVRFIEHFRVQGVSLQALRKAAQTARDEWKISHPFATSKAKYLTDRKQIFQATATELGDTLLLNLVTKQFAMYVTMEESLDRGLAFDPSTGLARQWKPRPKEFPQIALDPLVAYGQPAIMPTGIPTSTIYSAWKAEDGDIPSVANWYEIEVSSVRQAIDFELSMLN